MPDGVRLPMRVYSAGARPRAVVLALHGYNDYSRFIEQPAGAFARHGIETWSYDQRGFGEAPGRGRWAGTDVLIGDFRAVVREVRRARPNTPLFVLGESMGGAVIAVALARQREDAIDGVILVTPAVWSWDTMPWYQRFGIWIGARLSPGLTLSSDAFDIAPTDNAEARRTFAEDPLTIKQTRLDTLEGLTDLMDDAMPSVPKIRQRTLVVYGLRDVMMPRAPMIALLERWPPGPAPNFRFAAYPDGYHVLLRDLQRRVVWQDLETWMLDPRAALPSGFERDREEMLRSLRAAPAS
jgi:acylglycerol lipase